MRLNVALILQVFCIDERVLAVASRFVSANVDLKPLVSVVVWSGAQGVDEVITQALLNTDFPDFVSALSSENLAIRMDVMRSLIDAFEGQLNAEHMHVLDSRGMPLPAGRLELLRGHEFSTHQMSYSNTHWLLSTRRCVAHCRGVSLFAGGVALGFEGRRHAAFVFPDDFGAFALPTVISLDGHDLGV